MSRWTSNTCRWRPGTRRFALPIELYHATEAVTPFMGDGFLRPARPDEVQDGVTEGVFRSVPREAFQRVETWSFAQLMAFVRA